MHTGVFVRQGLLPLVFAVFVLPQLRAQSIFDSLRVAARAEFYFASGHHTLPEDALQQLDSFSAAWRLLLPGISIRITAYTDSVGSPARNLALSERRARAVWDALVQRGLPANKMSIAYFGEANPAAGNSSEEGRQQNRRASLEAITAIPMSPYSGQVKDQKTGEGIPATLFFSTRTLRDSLKTDSAGFFNVRLPKDSVVKTEAYAEGYFFKSQVQRMLGTPEMLRLMQNKPIQLALTPAVAGEKAVLNNLFFVGNEAVLLKTSEPELPKILKFMQINPDIVVEIAGHINHPGVTPEKLEKWEWALSVNRAKLVYTYLVTHGIPPARMQFKGYGNSEMLFPKPGGTEAQMEQNRRVEIRVLK
ncbi:MAG: OmpA family protein [Saprospiraceae bacterium]|nr:OmpA family protein [Saprospiraceae bacterium]